MNKIRNIVIGFLIATAIWSLLFIWQSSLPIPSLYGLLREQTETLHDDSQRKADFVLIAIFTDLLALKRQIDGGKPSALGAYAFPSYKIGDILLSFREKFDRLDAEVGVGIAQLVAIVEWYNKAFADFTIAHCDNTAFMTSGNLDLIKRHLNGFFPKAEKLYNDACGRCGIDANLSAAMAENGVVELRQVQNPELEEIIKAKIN